MTTKQCTIKQRHCEQCGSTDPEDVNDGDQGYSACCNEIVTDARWCRGHHLEDGYDPELVVRF